MSAIELALRGHHALVVDDDPDFREVVKAALARNGMTVSTAADAAEAFRKCLASPPALILMDVQMPGLNGIEACESLKKSLPTAGVPIILMSGHWRDEHQLIRAFDSGADDVLSKEQSGKELMARVRSVLALAAARQRPQSESHEFVAVCAACKRVHAEKEGWVEIELYLRQATASEITHGICPGCRERLYGKGND